MGDSYGAQRGLWWDGTSDVSSTTIQDDMAVISSSTNGFGYRPQDHGQSIATANALSLSGTNVSGSGIIEKTSDTDFFSFSTAAGSVTLNVNTIAFGATMHAKLQLFNASGTLIATAANANTLGQTITATLAAGTYYLSVDSYGQYGDVGQYTVSGTVALPPTPVTLTQSSDHQHINWTQGTSSGQILIGDANGLSFTGDGQDDPITLNYANGDPLPAVLHLSGIFTIIGFQGTNPLSGTTLDIGTSTVFINYANTSSDPIAAIKSCLQNGYNNGAWNGAPTPATGVITSSAAAANTLKNTAIGYADFNDGSSVDATPNTIELKYTLAGDTNLDGTVNATDLSALLASYGHAGGWTSGDSTYDGQVSIVDLNNLLVNYGMATERSCDRAGHGAAACRRRFVSDSAHSQSAGSHVAGFPAGPSRLTLSASADQQAPPLSRKISRKHLIRRLALSAAIAIMPGEDSRRDVHATREAQRRHW